MCRFFKQRVGTSFATNFVTHKFLDFCLPPMRSFCQRHLYEIKITVWKTFQSSLSSESLHQARGFLLTSEMSGVWQLPAVLELVRGQYLGEWISVSASRTAWRWSWSIWSPLLLSSCCSWEYWFWISSFSLSKPHSPSPFTSNTSLTVGPELLGCCWGPLGWSPQHWGEKSTCQVW